VWAGWIGGECERGERAGCRCLSRLVLGRLGVGYWCYAGWVVDPILVIDWLVIGTFVLVIIGLNKVLGVRTECQRICDKSSFYLQSKEDIMTYHQRRWKNCQALQLI
jgi:hypothetical protein